MRLINIIRLSLATVCAGVAMTGCDHQELDLYSGVPAAVFIQEVANHDAYGNPLSYRPNAPELSLTDYPPGVSYAYISFTVRLAGELADYDRTYVLKVDPENTTAIEGVDFDMSENTFTIAANKNSDEVKVKVLRNDRLLHDTYKITFRLEANENFELAINQYKNSSSWNVDGDMYDATTYSVSFSEKYTAPDFWSRYEDTYFGTFSAKKFSMINTIMGWTQNDWEYAGYSGQKILPGKLPFAMTAMRRVLIEEAEKGTPVLDDDGKPMQLADDYAIDYSLYI